MAFIYQLNRGSFGCSLRSTVHIGLLHYMVHGFFIMSFVFTNDCYPPFYYADKFFGWLRFIFGVLLAITVFSTVVSTFVYTIERWNDVIITIITKNLRKPLERDLPDYFWFTLAVLSCLICPVLIFYLVYIMSYLCNENKPFATEIHQPGMAVRQTPSPGVSLQSDSYSSKTYKPYPTQHSN